MMKSLVAGALALAVWAAPAWAQDPHAENASMIGTRIVDYAADSNWLCLPGRADACATPLPTAALNANGYGSVGQVTPAARTEVDCFYVYPTVSTDPGLNSDLTPGPSEQGTAMVQFARFASVCRPFAPIYRQMTLASIPRALGGEDVTAASEIAYGDVRAAFRDFIANRNDGRPFVLVGHSQGSLHLTRLLAEEIEGKPVAARMLSAMLLGWNIEVPEGQLVGGSFRSTPLCSRAGQTGCVIAFTSYRAATPPPADAFLGRTRRPGMTVACANPAKLSGGTGALDSYWFTGPGFGGNGIEWSSEGAPPVPFLRTEGLVSAACVNRGGAGYLSVMVNADPADARTDRIPGDVSLSGRSLPGWGLHLADMNLVQGDLLRIVEEQARAYRRR